MLCLRYGNQLFTFFKTLRTVKRGKNSNRSTVSHSLLSSLHYSFKMGNNESVQLVNIVTGPAPCVKLLRYHPWNSWVVRPVTGPVLQPQEPRLRQVELLVGAAQLLKGTFKGTETWTQAVWPPQSPNYWDRLLQCFCFNFFSLFTSEYPEICLSWGKWLRLRSLFIQIIGEP